jgi:hypothetical protein
MNSKQAASNYDPVEANAPSERPQKFEHAATYEASAYDEDDTENLRCGDDFGDEGLDVLY